MKRGHYIFAGQTMKIKDDVKEIGGEEIKIEDYWENIYGKSWMFANGNPAAMMYGIRVGMSNLPIDNEVVYGKIGSVGYLVYVSELETYKLRFC